MNAFVFTLALKPKIKQSYNIWLYYTSLICLVLLSFSSNYLDEIASGQTNFSVENIGLFTIIQYCLMAFFMLIAWLLTPKVPVKLALLKNYKAIFITAVLVRLVLIDVAPYTSNDASRYLFDGRIAYEGYDPYRISHDAEQLTELRKQWQPPQEHLAYVTIYPPLALALFAYSSSFGVENAELAWRCLLLLAGLLTVWFSALVLKKAGKLEHLALVALSPLLILETGVGLHLDAFSTLAVAAALYLWQHNFRWYCGIAIGIGMSLKVLPVMLLLPLIFLQKSLKNAFALVAGWIATVGIIYAVTIALGYIPVGSVAVFFEKWRNASAVFLALDNLVSGYQLIAILLIIAFLTILMIALVSFKNSQGNNKNSDAIYYCMQLSLALPLLLSPVLFPWYLMPLVPLLALRPNIYLFTWLLLMPLTYEVLGDFLCCRLWQPAEWPIFLLGILYSLTLLKILHSWLNQYDKAPATIDSGI
jgi:hypothetical protein